MPLFAKKIRVMIVGDDGPILAKLRGRVELFWPADLPVKTLAFFCGWADEAIDGIQEFRPDLLLLNHVFQRDEKTGLDVARWIDAQKHRPIRVAVYGDLSAAELRQLYQGVQCVRHVISGEGVRDFLRDCLRGEDAVG